MVGHCSANDQLPLAVPTPWPSSLDPVERHQHLTCPSTVFVFTVPELENKTNKFGPLVVGWGRVGTSFWDM